MAVHQQTLEVEVVDFANSWVDRWNAHDVDRILALVTEDVIWEDPSIDGTANGLADAGAYIAHLFRAFPDIAWSMPAALLVSVEEDREVLTVGQRWACRGTMLGPLDPPGFAPTGKAFELEGIDVWELQRERRRLRRVVSHYDGLEFARRVGLVPARASSQERMLLRLQRARERFSRWTHR
jgi:steroid delta-isomerase-like uncharacterized protein